MNKAAKQPGTDTNVGRNLTPEEQKRFEIIARYSAAGFASPDMGWLLSIVNRLKKKSTSLETALDTNHAVHQKLNDDYVALKAQLASEKRIKACIVLRKDAVIKRLKEQYIAEKQRADAAIDDLYKLAVCEFCRHYNGGCIRMVERMGIDHCFEWRGPSAEN